MCVALADRLAAWNHEVVCISGLFQVKGQHNQSSGLYAVCCWKYFWLAVDFRAAQCCFFYSHHNINLRNNKHIAKDCNSRLKEYQYSGKTAL